MLSFNRIKILDFLSGKDIWNYYQMYLKTQWYSENEMRKFQIQKLKKLLTFCCNNVPFYRDITKERNIKIDKIDSLEILKQFPVIDKVLVKNNYDRFLSREIRKIKKIKIKYTSGTTGNVLECRTDAATRSSVWASYQRFYDWIGKKPNDLVIHIKTAHVIDHLITQKIVEITADFLAFKRTFSAYDLSENTLEQIICLFKKHKTPILRGYTQALFDIARIFELRRLSFNLRAVITTAEPLLDYHRELFRKVFNCEIFDQYGCGEIEAIAYECNHHQGLHITEERVITEVDDNQELIVTDLDNYVFPFIRYKNGDRVVVSDKKCGCGRTSKVIQKIIGRTSDNVRDINGNPVHWGLFHQILMESGIAAKRNLVKFQVVQKSNNNIVFKFVSEELSSNDKLLIIQLVRKALGNISVQVINVDEIPIDHTGKYKAVISEISHNNSV